MLLQLLARAVEVLNAAGGAETTFFYQAYLLEREHVTDLDYRGIAPGYATEKKTIVYSFDDFVDYISTEDARKCNENNLGLFTEIFDNAGDTPLVETSRKLREAGFRAEYDITRLYPRGKDSRSVTITIQGMRGIATATKKNKY
ncbi:hypothetical protein BDV10DRAFT_190143 [Aspergillus recurvatus]